MDATSKGNIGTLLGTTRCTHLAMLCLAGPYLNNL